MYHVNIAHHQHELERIIQLRYDALRKPWGQSLESATDDLEATSINAFIENKFGEIVACGRLQFNTKEIAQIRYMAVSLNEQGKGLGKAIVKFLEQEAKKQSITIIQLQARDNAVAFYTSCGYTIKEPSFLLWGIIQHYLMEKHID